MKKHPVLSVVVALIFLGLPCSASFGKGTDVSADAALKALKEGNERYTQAKQIHPNAGKDRRTATTVNGQSPFASILSCSDSRVPLEIIFDQGIGDLFVVRVAGNQANSIETASLEFGTAVLGTPLILVMGHTHCGAVVGAIQTDEARGEAPALLKSIISAVAQAKKNEPSASGEALVKAATEANVLQAIADILQSSPTISGKVKAGKLQIQGAMYDIETGKVTWMGPHPKQDQLTSSK